MRNLLQLLETDCTLTPEQLASIETLVDELLKK